MKRMLCVLAVVFLMTGFVFAQEEKPKETEISLKQGFVISWDTGEIKNMTTVEIAKTAPIESLGKWNVLIDGWTLDAGFPFENSTEKDACLMLGREFGTLGKYLPFIKFPFKDKLIITLYPIGLYAKDLLNFNTLKLKGCSGGAFIKATLKF